MYDLGGDDLQPGLQTVNNLGITLVEGSTYSIQYILYDLAGNVTSSGNYTSVSTGAKYDVTAPTVTTISTTQFPTTVTKTLGNSVAFKVHFDEQVKSDASVTVTFETGNPDGTATIAAWDTEVSSKSGTYTVGAGEETDRLNITSIVAGGNITDEAGNVMAGAGFDIDGGGNLTNAANITVDGIVPTISSVTSTSGSPGYYSTGEPVNITVNFSEELNLDKGNLVVTLETGDPDQTVEIGFADIVEATTVAGTYTVVAGDENLTGLTSTLSINGAGTLSDVAGNELTNLDIPADLLDGPFQLYVETTAPTIGTLTANANDQSYGFGATIPVVVTFINGVGGAAENVNLHSGTFDITLATGGAGRTVSISSDWNGSTATGNYVVAENETSSDLSASGLAIGGGGSVTDRYGNELSATPLIPHGANINDPE